MNTVSLPKDLTQRAINAFVNLAGRVSDNDEGDRDHQIYMRDANLLNTAMHYGKEHSVDLAERAIEAFQWLSHHVPDNDEGDYWSRVYSNDANSIRNLIHSKKANQS